MVIIVGKFANKYNTETAKLYVRSLGCELLSEYEGMNSPHTFLCSCGNKFSTTFAKFQNRNKRQCNKCGRSKSQEQMRHKIEFVKEKIAEYGCECLSSSYSSCKEKLSIKCSCGNIFNQTYSNFINGKHQCQKCSQISSNEFKNKYTYDFVRDLIQEHDSELVTEKTKEYIGYKDHISIKCSCGEVFSTQLGIVLGHNKYKCFACNVKNAPVSHGENRIKEYLSKNNFQFVQQYMFDDCRGSTRCLPFDFMVIVNGNKKLIEFDGIQHFKPFDYYGGEPAFEKRIKRDKIKTDYCYTHNIPLLRIPYSQINEIPDILDKYLSA